MDVSCPSDHPSLEAGLCYKKCPEGYDGVLTECLPKCPQGMTDLGLLCKGFEYTNGSFFEKTCPKDHPTNGVAYCYEKCPDGYYDNGFGYCAVDPFSSKNYYGRGAGFVGWTDDEAKKNCENSNDHGAKSNGCEKCGLLWYPKCDEGFYPDLSNPFPCNFCQNKDAKTYKMGYVERVCGEGNVEVKDSLGISHCMAKCLEGYSYDPTTSLLGIPMCSKDCPPNFTDMGILGCSKNDNGNPRGVGIVPTYSLSENAKRILIIIAVVLGLILLAIGLVVLKIIWSRIMFFVNPSSAFAK